MEGQIDWSSSGTGPSTMGRILPLPTEFILLKRNVKLLMLHLFGLEVPECCLWISNKGKPPFSLCYAIELKFRAARHSPRPRTGSNRHSRICSPIHFHYVTQPNPPPHVPKSNGCSSFPAPSFSTYAGGAPYMTGGGLPEKRGQLLSPLPPCSIFLF